MARLFVNVKCVDFDSLTWIRQFSNHPFNLCKCICGAIIGFAFDERIAVLSGNVAVRILDEVGRSGV